MKYTALTTWTSMALGAMMLCSLSRAGGAAVHQEDRDLDTVKARLIESLLPSTPSQLASAERAARTDVDSLKADGSWKDIDYTDKSPANWKAAAHLDRLRVMARAYRAPGSALWGEADIRIKALAALDYWLQHDPTNPNWWWNQIGAPQSLGQIMLLLAPDLSAQELRSGVSVLHRSDMERVNGKIAARWTGANLVWMAGNEIMRGLLENDRAAVAGALDAIYGEIRITPPGAEGIQPDFSFHQHGAVLYSGGYGAAFTEDCADYAFLTRETGLAMPPDRLKILSDYVLDGQQWMVWHGVYDYGCTGREITRRGKSARGLAGAIEKLAQVAGPRQQEFAAFDRRLRGEPGAKPLVGNRQFWLSDIMVQRRPGYYTSARMYSLRTLNTDGYINGENKKSHHLADGATYIFRTGDEYRDIFPVWDWKRIPGTTCEHSAAPMDPHQVQQRGTTGFVGGVSDGMYGAAAMDLERDGLSARKAWFYFDDEFVCLGAGITSTTDAPILTSVNQCLLMGPVIGSNSSAPLREGSAVEEGPGGWVLHDGIGYLFPATGNGGVIYIQNQVQTGSWAEIGVGSPAPVSLPVFSVWIDQGVKPVQASYEYIVVPGATAESLAAQRANDPIQILSNTTALQAVRQTKLKMVEAVFAQAGKLAGGAGWNISVDQPCLLLLRETAGGLEISVSNPDNQPLGVNVTVDRDLTGDGATPRPGGGTRIHFDLPGGPEAGRSVIRAFRKRFDAGN